MLILMLIYAPCYSELSIEEKQKIIVKLKQWHIHTNIISQQSILINEQKKQIKNERKERILKVLTAVGISGCSCFVTGWILGNRH